MIHHCHDHQPERQKAQNAASGKYGKGFPSELTTRTKAMLSALDAAAVLDDLRFPPGNNLEAMPRDRKGQNSIRLNQQWRICFVWTSEGPKDVEIAYYD